MLASTSELASGSSTFFDDDFYEDEDEIGAVCIGQIFFLDVRSTSGFPQDSMGSVIGAADASGGLSASVKYDSFGEVVSATGTAAASSAVGGDFRLHGMWLDDVSGLYHVRARTYDAATGRFLSRDPVAGVMRRPESMNPYVFCNSNGWVWRDPSGEIAATLTGLMTNVTIIGIIAATSFTVGAAATYFRERGHRDDRPASYDSFAECVERNRLVDDDWTNGIENKINMALPQSLEINIDGEGGLLALGAAGMGAVYGHAAKMNGGVVARAIFSALRSLTGTQQGIGPGFTSFNGALAYYIRQVIVQHATSFGGVAQLASTAAGKAQMFASQLGHALTPLLVAWGGHDTGAIVACGGLALGDLYAPPKEDQ